MGNVKTNQKQAMLHSLGQRVFACRQAGWNRSQICREVSRAFGSGALELIDEAEKQEAARMNTGDVEASLSIPIELANDKHDELGRWASKDSSSESVEDSPKVKEAESIIANAKKDGNIILFHSGDASLDKDLASGIEPMHGAWLDEVLGGATDDEETQEHIRNSDNLAAFYSTDPGWVSMKVSRVLGSRTNVGDVTVDDVRKHGQLSIVVVSPEESGVYRADDERQYAHSLGFDDKSRRISEGRDRISDLPFGVEPNDIFATESKTPEITLTGNDLVKFLARNYPKSNTLKSYEAGLQEPTRNYDEDRNIQSSLNISIELSNPNHDEHGKFATSNHVAEINQEDRNWSDDESFRGALSCGDVKDGMHAVEPYLYLVKDGKATIQKDKDVIWNDEKGAYDILPREMPPERIEDRTYTHGTTIDVGDVTKLKPGKGTNFGENEYDAIYLAQKGTHFVDWGSKEYDAKLSPGTKIAKTSAEIREAVTKHPGMNQQQALEAEGYHGVAHLDIRGDVWELALFKNRLVPVAKAMSLSNENHDEKGRFASKDDFNEVNWADMTPGRLASRYPKIKGSNELVDGRRVTSNVDNQDSISASLTHYEIMPGIRRVPLSDLVDPAKPYTHSYSVERTNRVKELAEQIERNKKISPLIVAVAAEGPYVLEGSHRIDALALLHATYVPAMVVVDTDEVSLEHKLSLEVPIELANDAHDKLGRFATKDNPKVEAAIKDWKENGVKAKAFKEWFGDWENNPQEASKVVNHDHEPQTTHTIPSDGSLVVGNDGKPIVVYHGTSHGGFEEYDKSKVNDDDLYGPGFYFTENKTIAQSYEPVKGVGEELPEDLRKAWADKADEIINKLPPLKPNKSIYNVVRTDADKRAYARQTIDLVRKEGALNQVANAQSFVPALREAAKVLPAGLRPETQENYLNIRKPFDINQGASDRELLEHLSKVLPKTNPHSDTLSRESWEGARKFFDVRAKEAKVFGMPFLNEKIYDNLQRVVGKVEANHLLQQLGYDGITHIAGDIMGGGKIHHRVWIAFNPEQVKSVDNRGTFDAKSKNIKLSLMVPIKLANENHDELGRFATGSGVKGETPNTVVTTDTQTDTEGQEKQRQVMMEEWKAWKEIYERTHVDSEWGQNVYGGTGYMMNQNKSVDKLISKINRMEGGVQGLLTKYNKANDAMEEAVNVYNKLVEEKRAADDPELIAADKKIDETGDKYSAAQETYYKARDAKIERMIQAVRNHLKENLQDRLEPAAHINMMINPNLYNTEQGTGSKQAGEAIQKATELLRGCLSETIGWRSTQCVVEKADPKSYYGGNRPYFQKSITGTHSMHLPEHAQVTDVLHEFGHCIETDSNISLACREFLHHRVGVEEPVCLADKFPNSNFQRDELGRSDDFAKLMGKTASGEPGFQAYYAGRYYRDGSTEILSMGMERLFWNPRQFAQADPEYFKFVVCCLDGTFTRPEHRK